jgi:hypothetical protein
MFNRGLLGDAKWVNWINCGGPLIDKIDKAGIDPGTRVEKFDMHDQYRVPKLPAANTAEPIRIQG